MKLIPVILIPTLTITLIGALALIAEVGTQQASRNSLAAASKQTADNITRVTMLLQQQQQITIEQQKLTAELRNHFRELETGQASAALFGYEAARQGLSRDQFAWQARQLFPNATIWNTPSTNQP